jgi:hypothetical protein
LDGVTRADTVAVTGGSKDVETEPLFELGALGGGKEGEKG